MTTGIHRNGVMPALDLEPVQLTPDDIPVLRLDDHPRASAAEARALLEECPGASYWIPATGEFLLVGRWRHRSELSTIHTFGAFANEPALIDAVMDHASENGQAGLVLVDVNETRQPAFYVRHGLRRIEDIVTYEHRRPSRLVDAPLREALEFRRVDGADPGLLAEVLALDHSAFPWFWRNSEEEFLAYFDYPGVEVWAGLRNREVVAYAGSTHYLRWGHLDRIATRPDLQGSGIGRAMLARAAAVMLERGCRRLALSTQHDNLRSRDLYQRSGFTRTPQDDYGIFVAPFDESLIYAGMAR